QGKAKGLAACSSQTTSPFGCLNKFCFQILSNFLGSLHYYIMTIRSIYTFVNEFFSFSESLSGPEFTVIAKIKITFIFYHKHRSRHLLCI
ncbi:hypothetical protein ACTQW9_16505, partial [Lachnospiraceae bacterium LCP19S3_B12]